MAKIRSDDSNYPSRYSPNKDENGIAWVTDRQIVTREESVMAKDALKWAAMTYVVVA